MRVFPSRLADVTASSVARTDIPSMMDSGGELLPSFSAPPSRASSARAWPAESTPAATSGAARGSAGRSGTDHVGDERPRPADPGGKFIVGDFELVE